MRIPTAKGRGIEHRPRARRAASPETHTQRIKPSQKDELREAGDSTHSKGVTLVQIPKWSLL